MKPSRCASESSAVATATLRLASGTLKRLPLRDGGESMAMLYLVFADRDAAGPGALRLAAIIRERADAACKEERKKS